MPEGGEQHKPHDEEKPHDQLQQEQRHDQAGPDELSRSTEEASWLSEYPKRAGSPEDIARIDREYAEAAKDPATARMRELIWGPGGTYKAYKERMVKGIDQSQSVEQQSSTDANKDARQSSKSDRPLRRHLQRALTWLRHRR